MNLINKIKQFILTEVVNNVNITINNTDSLIESGIIDSLAIMKLMIFLEKEFSIQITNNDIMPENFESFESIANLVAGKVKN